MKRTLRSGSPAPPPTIKLPPPPTCTPLLPRRTGGSQTNGTLQAEPPGALRPPRAREEAEVSPEGVHEEEREAHGLLQHPQRFLLGKIC